MSYKYLTALIGELRDIALGEAIAISPDAYRAQHGRCPPGFHFDGTSCARLGAQSGVQQANTVGPNQPKTTPPGTPPAVSKPPGSTDTNKIILGKQQNQHQAAQAALSALKKLAIGSSNSSGLPVLSTGETITQFARREFMRGYLANPVTRLMFPDAFDDVLEFIRAVKTADTEMLTDLSDVKNTDAGDQIAGNFPQLMAKLWRLNRDEWTREQRGDVSAAYRLYQDHLEGIVRGAAKEWKAAPPVLIALYRDETTGVTTRWMFSGNERATIYRALGMPVPSKEIPFKGRIFATPVKATIEPIVRAYVAGESLDAIELKVSDMVKKKCGPAPEKPIPGLAVPATSPDVTEAIADLRPPPIKQSKKSKTFSRTTRKSKHLHQPTAGVEHPTPAARPLPQRLPPKKELSQSEPASLSAVLTVPDQASEMPSGGPPSLLGRIPLPISTKPWVDHLEGLPLDTRRANLDPETRRYFPDRVRLHESIRKTFLDKASSVDRDHKPVAIITMGGPASGKSTIVGVVSQSNFVTCDLDAVKEFIPEYQQAILGRARDASFMAHHESKDIMHSIRNQAVADRKNVILDGTGQHLASYTDMIRRLTAQGYHCKLIMTDVDPELGWMRQQKRAEQTGRSIDRYAFDSIYSIVPFNFESVAREVVDFELWDTRTNPPTLKWEKLSGNEAIIDPEFVNSFRSLYSRAATKKEWADIMSKVNKTQRSSVGAE